MTQEQHRRVTQALIDTQRDLDREMLRYSPGHREHDLITFYHHHIAELVKMLGDHRETAA